jgi:hypothetical protein
VDVNIVDDEEEMEGEAEVDLDQEDTLELDELSDEDLISKL